MKVLFQSYCDFGRMYGGGPTVVYSLAQELRQLGVEVVFHDYWRDDPREFDLIHYFSCYDAITWQRHQAGDPPLVVTPISWYAFSRWKRFEKQLKHLLRVIRHRTRDRRRLGDPFVIPAHYFPNCRGEAEHFSRWCGVSMQKMTIVPHGVSRRFESGDPGPFVERFGVRDFVLCVGRFEPPRKNQLTLVRAMKHEGVPLVFIGGPELGHTSYFEQCRSEAGTSALFTGPIEPDHPLLVSAFHACKVLVMPAILESPGLTGMEAALAGANLAVTTGGSTREHFGDLAWYFDPMDQVQMRESIMAALQAPRREALKQRVRSLYTWDQIAKVQLAAYESVLRSNGSGKHGG